MRKSFIVTAIGIALFTAPATAQEVQRIKASGANLAGACAGAFEIFAQYVVEAEGPTSGKLMRISTARDFFADHPGFEKAQISAAAEAFLRLMGKRHQDAKSEAETTAIDNEIKALADQCYEVVKKVSALRNSGLPANPESQPLEIQPAEAKPLEWENTGPLPLDGTQITPAPQ